VENRSRTKEINEPAYESACLPIPHNHFDSSMQSPPSTPKETGLGIMMSIFPLIIYQKTKI
jgi:hypothetical protein